MVSVYGTFRPESIMLLILRIMLLSNSPKKTHYYAFASYALIMLIILHYFLE